MATLRLASGVCVSTTNESIIAQYLKYGAIEVKQEASIIDAPVDNKVEEVTSSKTARKRK